MNAALAGRVAQLDAEREHRRAVAEFRAHRRADEQARINALLSELVAALAELPLGRSPGSGPRRAETNVTALSHDAAEADPWPDFERRTVRCPEPTCREWSPELPDPDSAITWAEAHTCQRAATERNAA